MLVLHVHMYMYLCICIYIYMYINMYIHTSLKGFAKVPRKLKGHLANRSGGLGKWGYK